MIGWERRVLLRHHPEQGREKTETGRVVRHQIHCWMRDGELDQDLEVETVRYGPRPAVATKLDCYKGVLLGRLAEHPELTAYGCSARSRQAAIRAPRRR